MPAGRAAGADRRGQGLTHRRGQGLTHTSSVTLQNQPSALR